ncbi:uncharacterized protein LOC114841639 [Diachasma alloeum]|uniref:uncharacterized protein LOC114841639 n=1 Tax=Diachasma alloeum TaxID=454923 RepID=UPI0010FAE5A4|nr:uncharacterized protein LOC114841639 [Diachasma alloeum]
MNGVKGPTPFSRQDHVDLVWSFPPDYMHGILLGIVKSLWVMWKRQGCLSAADRRQIEKRYVQIRRPREIHRRPRTLKDIAKFKPTEWKSWLLYDSVPCLEGILDEDRWKSYCLLVDSVATFLKTRITLEEKDRCDIQLLQFFGDSQKFYGPEIMTFNFHIALHAGEAIDRCGPLWCYSTFPFENGIFHFKGHVLSSTGVTLQMTNKHLKHMVLKSNIRNNTTSPACRDFCLNLWKPKLLRKYLRTENDLILIGAAHDSKRISTLFSKFLHCTGRKIKLYKRSIFRDMVLRSINYNRSKKTNDTVVKLRDHKFFRIHNFIYDGSKGYVHGRQISASIYEYNGVIIHHLFRVTCCNGPELIIDPNEIEEKLIFFTIDDKTYIACFPNNVEIQ